MAKSWNEVADYIERTRRSSFARVREADAALAAKLEAA